MTTLILDQYTHQSAIKRLIGNTLTGLGWIFWVYLWLPLLAAIALLCSSQSVYQNNGALQSILEMFAILNSHLTIVLVMIAVFLAWSILQWLARPCRDSALKKQKTDSAISKQPRNHKVSGTPHWQSAQRMLVSHDAKGCIQEVKVM